MYDELVKDLREWPRVCQQYEDSIDQLHDQSADAIEQLAADLERSREWEAFWEKEANEALKKFQTTVASMPRWIPVTERLPELDKEVLVYAVCKIDGFIGSSVFALSERFLFKFFPSSEGTEEWRSPWQYFMTDYEITHWMPLPPAPKEET